MGIEIKKREKKRERMIEYKIEKQTDTGKYAILKCEGNKAQWLATTASADKAQSLLEFLQNKMKKEEENNNMVDYVIHQIDGRWTIFQVTEKRGLISIDTFETQEKANIEVLRIFQLCNSALINGLMRNHRMEEDVFHGLEKLQTNNQRFAMQLARMA